MKVQIVANRFPQLRREIPRALEARLKEAAVDLRDTIRDELKSGALPIQSDTGALADSLSVQSSDGTSDIAVRMGKAKADYVSGSSRYGDAVKALVTGAAYTSGHFNERTASEDALPDGIAASVLTLLAWGLWWEMGHNNVFTGKSETPRAWMEPITQRWAMAELEKHFVDLLK